MASPLKTLHLPINCHSDKPSLHPPAKSEQPSLRNFPRNSPNINCGCDRTKQPHYITVKEGKRKKKASTKVQPKKGVRSLDSAHYAPRVPAVTLALYSPGIFPRDKRDYCLPRSSLFADRSAVACASTCTVVFHRSSAPRGREGVGGRAASGAGGGRERGAGAGGSAEIARLRVLR